MRYVFNKLKIFNNNLAQSSLAVESGFGQKFKPDPRVDVRSGWTN
jgi:hypothetical protein